MTAIQGINLTSADESKLKQVVQQQQKTATTTNNQKIFGGLDYTNEKDTIKSNTAAFQNMDEKAQSIIMDNINKAAAKHGGDGTGVIDFKTVAADFNKNGYTAKYIESDHAADNAVRNGRTTTPGVEITTPDGKTFRIWDGNGNGGIDSKDFSLDKNLKNFVSDVKAAGTTNSIPQVAGTQATETPNALKAADKTKKVDDKQILDYIKTDLRAHGTVAEPQVEPKAQEMLPVFKLLLSLDLPWINKLFNLDA